MVFVLQVEALLFCSCGMWWLGVCTETQRMWNLECDVFNTEDWRLSVGCILSETSLKGTWAERKLVLAEKICNMGDLEPRWFLLNLPLFSGTFLWMEKYISVHRGSVIGRFHCVYIFFSHKEHMPCPLQNVIKKFFSKMIGVYWEKRTKHIDLNTTSVQSECSMLCDLAGI